MTAGVLLGPSLFGLLAPSAQQWLFPTKAVIEVAGHTTTIPHPSMSILYAISQVGLILYMFLVGHEFNVMHIQGRARHAGLISLAGIVVPMIAGGVLALTVYDRVEFFTPGLSRYTAALYLGVSMSITAFPMLARILDEKRITRTRLGTLILAAGLFGDAIAWCFLAVVLATFDNSPMIALITIGGGILYTVLMLIVVRPRLTRFERLVQKHDGLTPHALTVLLGIIMLCAWATDAIGIYAVFGAFIAGTAMPRGRFAEEVRNKLESLTTALLLPVFFVFSGLNTQLGLVSSWRLFGLMLVVLAVAILGKGIACMVTARTLGESWRDSAAIGTLMNARGLMELIILNIGLERGLITPTLFTIMVMMTVVTTLMASPLFDWIHGWKA